VPNLDERNIFKNNSSISVMGGADSKRILYLSRVMLMYQGRARDNKYFSRHKAKYKKILKSRIFVQKDS
jgi:hypothetical protein